MTIIDAVVSVTTWQWNLRKYWRPQNTSSPGSLEMHSLEVIARLCEIMLNGHATTGAITGVSVTNSRTCEAAQQHHRRQPQLEILRDLVFLCAREQLNDLVGINCWLEIQKVPFPNFCGDGWVVLAIDSVDNIFDCSAVCTHSVVGINCPIA